MTCKSRLAQGAGIMAIMERIHGINAERLQWCCRQAGMSPEELAGALKIAPATLARALEGENCLTVNQLKKIANYFSRGMLFFLEPGPVDDATVHSVQFRTLENQKPDLGIRLQALVERVEFQRQVYISLLEDLGEETNQSWYPRDLDLNPRNLKQAAAKIRAWLRLPERLNFETLRQAVERKGVLVFVSNGYAGAWQIPKESRVRGFSLFFNAFPIILVRKQRSEGAQAFTLIHELAHLLLHRESFIDDELDLDSREGHEQQANRLAGNLLVPDIYLDEVDLADFPEVDVEAYDNYLREYARRWCVSPEVILRRLVDERVMPRERYQAYRGWKRTVPAPEGPDGGFRYRYNEPVRIFGKPYVGAVLDALHTNQISLARASSYLDNLKIGHIRRLEERHVHL